MIVVTLQREKCIGCNYCAEFSPDFFRMSKKDGKSVLLKSVQKKEFFIVKTPIDDFHDNLKKAADACPVKIITIKNV